MRRAQLVCSSSLTRAHQSEDLSQVFPLKRIQSGMARKIVSIVIADQSQPSPRSYLFIAAAMTTKITNAPTMALARNEKSPAPIKMPSKAKTKPFRG